MASTTAGQEPRKDQWTTEKYSNAASFVPQLTTKVVKYLDPQSTDVILDVGCGDGILTAEIAARCKSLVGLDASSSFIDTAQSKYRNDHPNATFIHRDCRRLEPVIAGYAIDSDSKVLAPGIYDKIFSNAAFHWILRDQETRRPVFADMFKVLKPGGKLVFEMGGFGNCAAVHTAITAVLHLQYRIPLEKIRAADPWFFPSDTWMKQTLEGAGFEVQVVETEARQTKATPRSADGSGGIEGWMHLMAAAFLELLTSEQERKEAVQAMCEVLRDSVTKIEDGSQWIDYFRLRAIATKPSNS